MTVCIWNIFLKPSSAWKNTRKATSKKFITDTLVQDGVIRNLHTLAESTQSISENLKGEHPGIDWKAIAGFRNILVHDYLGIDLNRVWGVIENRLPVLKEGIKEMLAKQE